MHACMQLVFVGDAAAAVGSDVEGRCNMDVPIDLISFGEMAKSDSHCARGAAPAVGAFS